VLLAWLKCIFPNKFSNYKACKSSTTTDFSIPGSSIALFAQLIPALISNGSQILSGNSGTQREMTKGQSSPIRCLWIRLGAISGKTGFASLENRLSTFW
jgi:hypothetical protein